MIHLVMPWIIDYDMVLDQMRQQNLKSLYYNSGAFGFPPETPTQIVGWIGDDDPTLRPAARPLARRVPAPFVENLVERLVRVWQESLPGRAWFMPMSHWSYELEFGSRDWLGAVLEHIHIDPGLLITRNNAAAIEFAGDEIRGFSLFATRLLQMLQASDFAVTFPGRSALATLHHHKQIWWVSGDVKLTCKLQDLSDPPLPAVPDDPTANP